MISRALSVSLIYNDDDNDNDLTMNHWRLTFSVTVCLSKFNDDQLLRLRDMRS